MRKYKRHTTVNKNKNYKISWCRYFKLSALYVNLVSYAGGIKCGIYYNQSNKENITNQYE